MSAPPEAPDVRTATRDAMAAVLDAGLRPRGPAVHLPRLFARVFVAGASAVNELVGDDDVERLIEEVSCALPDVGFDWGDALYDGFPEELDEVEDRLRDCIEYGDGGLDSVLGEFLEEPRWVGGVSPNPYSRMACCVRVLAITWNGAVWFFERGDLDGMDQNWAEYAYTVGDDSGEAIALSEVAERWAGGDLCDHPDPMVRDSARRAYMDSRFEKPWNSDTSGWDDLIAGSADALVEEYGEALAEALETTPEEAERLVRSIKAYGPGDDPDLDNTEAALELWWLTDNWSSWWG
jgi:hypothetical protein